VDEIMLMRMMIMYDAFYFLVGVNEPPTGKACFEDVGVFGV
jgi:hypothetical protein